MKKIKIKRHFRKGKIVRQHSRLIKELPLICNIKKKRAHMGKHMKKKAYKKLRSWTPEEEEELSKIYGEDFDPDAGEWKY